MRAPKNIQLMRVSVFIAVVLLMLSGVFLPGNGIVAAQRSPAINSGQPIDPRPTGVPPLAAPAPGVRDQERAQAVDDDRHKRVASDVDKLVALSSELKTDLDKAGKDELSLEVVKKAQQIEKLAHDVQSRMKN